MLKDNCKNLGTGVTNKKQLQMNSYTCSSNALGEYRHDTTQ